MKLAAIILLAALAGPVHAGPADLAAPYRSDIQRSAQLYFGLPAPTPVLAAQLMQESGFRPDARSRVGALGLGQFMPATARWAGENDPGPGDPLDPKWAIRATAWYDRRLYASMQYPDDCSRWGATLSAYNGGIKWHNKRRETAVDRDDFWWSVRTINPGIATENQRENEAYPVRILLNLQPLFASWGRTACLN